jgi:hypothetical protein
VVSPHLFRASGLEVVSAPYWVSLMGTARLRRDYQLKSGHWHTPRLRACEIPPVHYVVLSSEVLWLTGYELRNRSARAVLQDITDDLTDGMGFHLLVTDDYVVVDVWDESHCHWHQSPPAPIWSTQYTADMGCNLWPLHQWGNATSPIFKKRSDRLCSVTEFRQAGYIVNIWRWGRKRG